jgi:hypothetical protein
VTSECGSLIRAEDFGKLPKTTGWQPVVHRVTLRWVADGAGRAEVRRAGGQD